MQTKPPSASPAEQFGNVGEDSPMRPMRRRVSAAVIVVTVLTTAALFGGIGFAIGLSFGG